MHLSSLYAYACIGELGTSVSSPPTLQGNRAVELGKGTQVPLLNATAGGLRNSGLMALFRLGSGAFAPVHGLIYHRLANGKKDYFYRNSPYSWTFLQDTDRDHHTIQQGYDPDYALK